jgi:Leucine-rich repeat (LRR) protein
MTGGAPKVKAHVAPHGQITSAGKANKSTSLSVTASLHAAPGSASHCLWRTLSQKCKMSPATSAPKLPHVTRMPFKPFDPLTDTLTPYPKEEELDAMADISEQFDGWDASWSADLDSIKAKVEAAAKVNKAYGATFFAHSFTVLNLHSAHITCIDAGFLNLVNLTSLSLSHNNICRIENLPTSLLSLDVSYNAITELPQSMPVPLKVLSLAFNHVSSLDALAVWFKVPRQSLVSLDCAFNDLSSLWNLRTLQGFSNLRCILTQT